MIQKEFIRSELRYRYPNLTDSILSPDQPVGRPLLFESGERRFGAHIIIAKSEELDTIKSENSRDALFLCIGSPSENARLAFDICVLPEQEHPGVILNFIQRLFDRLDDWTQSLRQAAETEDGVEQLLSRASGMLQNPVLLLDERGHVIAQSDQAEASLFTDRIPQELLLGDGGDNAVIHKIGGHDSPDAIYTKISFGSSYCLLACVASERQLYASDEIVFDSLVGFLRLMLSERRLRLSFKQIDPAREAAVRAFLTLFTRDAPEQEAMGTLRTLGWGEGEGYAILAIEPNNGDLRAAQADAICEKLNSSIHDSVAFTMLPFVVAVVRSALLESAALLNTLHAIARENALSFGVCESFAGFAFFPQRMEQAKRALNRSIDFGGVACYSDLFEQELIQNKTANFPPELVARRSVLALAAYDREHETNYRKTTELYLKNRFNAVKTASELFIHRSTFLYRLERIREQFGLDLDDPNLSMLHLLYSLRAVSD